MPSDDGQVQKFIEHRATCLGMLVYLAVLRTLAALDDGELHSRAADLHALCKGCDTAVVLFQDKLQRVQLYRLKKEMDAAAKEVHKGVLARASLDLAKAVFCKKVADWWEEPTRRRAISVEYRGSPAPLKAMARRRTE